MKSNINSRPRILLVNRCIVLKGKKILIILRSPGDRWDPNHWEFPGGKLDQGQDISYALEREVMEETGLLIHAVHRLSYWESRILSVGPYKGLPYLIMIGIGRVIGGKVTLSTEHVESSWVTPKEAYKMNLTEETRRALATLEKSL